MPKTTQRMAAVVLVTSLGLIVPGSFGGSVSADISHNPNLNDPFTLECDLDGNSQGKTTYDPDDYETTYDFVSTANSRVYHDPKSNTVMTQHERIDVLQAEYVPHPAGQPGDPAYVLDTEVEWFDEFFADDVYPHGKPKGRKTVRCVNISDPYEWTIPAEEAALEPRLVEGATYLETDWQLFEVMLSKGGQRVRAAGTDDAPSADRPHKAKKQGKHRGKGKRRR